MCSTRCRRSGRSLGEGVERLPDRTVADGVHLDLPAARIGQFAPRAPARPAPQRRAPALTFPSYGSSIAAVRDSTTPSAKAFENACRDPGIGPGGAGPCPRRARVAPSTLRDRGQGSCRTRAAREGSARRLRAAHPRARAGPGPHLPPGPSRCRVRSGQAHARAQGLERPRAVDRAGMWRVTPSIAASFSTPADVDTRGCQRTRVGPPGVRVEGLDVGGPVRDESRRAARRSACRPETPSRTSLCRQSTGPCASLRSAEMRRSTSACVSAP